MAASLACPLLSHLCCVIVTLGSHGVLLCGRSLGGSISLRPAPHDQVRENELRALSSFCLGLQSMITISGGEVVMLGNVASVLANVRVCGWNAQLWGLVKKTELSVLAPGSSAYSQLILHVLSLNIHDCKLHFQELKSLISFEVWKKKIIKIIGLLAYFCFPSLASMHAWMTPAPTGHISLSSAHCPPSLPIQTAAASLCATHYPAIPVSREEIVNVSGAGDRYMANFSVFPSYMWNHPNMISFKFYYKGKLCSVAWGAGTRTGPVTVIPCSAH